MKSINEKSGQLSIDEIMEFVLSIKPEDFNSLLVTKEYETKGERPDWAKYITSSSDYKSGVVTANTFHYSQEKRIATIAKNCISKNLEFIKTLYMLIWRNSDKLDIDDILFNQDYSLSTTIENNNKFMLAIYSLLMIKTMIGSRDEMDITKLLFESLSREDISEDNTMHILSVYAKELMKTINDQTYTGKLIEQLRQSNDEIHKAENLKSTDISRINIMTTLPNELKEASISEIVQEHGKRMEKIYKGTLDIFRE